MRSILIEKPYKFIPPIRAKWPQFWLLKLGAFKSYLRNECGVVAHECVQVVVPTPHLEALADALVKAAPVVDVAASVEASLTEAVETGPEPAITPATQT